MKSNIYKKKKSSKRKVQKKNAKKKSTKTKVQKMKFGQLTKINDESVQETGEKIIYIKITNLDKSKYEYMDILLAEENVKVSLSKIGDDIYLKLVFVDVNDIIKIKKIVLNSLYFNDDTTLEISHSNDLNGRNKSRKNEDKDEDDDW